MIQRIGATGYESLASGDALIPSPCQPGSMAAADTHCSSSHPAHGSQHSKPVTKKNRNTINSLFCEGNPVFDFRINTFLVTLEIIFKIVNLYSLLRFQ